MSRCAAALCLLAVLACDARPPAALREEPLGAAAELQARVAEARQRALPLPPTAQQLDAIRRVAQILALLGEQVLPAIAGAVSPSAASLLAAPGASAGDDDSAA